MAIAAVFLVLPLATQAREASPRPESDSGTRTGEHCKQVGERINKQITAFNEGKTKRLNTFNDLKTRLTRIEAKLTGKGYDTTQLKADQQVLAGKIQKFTTDYNLFMKRLQDAKGFNCGHSDGDFKEKLNQARAQLKTIQSDADEVRNYYHDTIRADIRALRVTKSPAPTP